MNNALAKRAVACKGWRWMPGMLDTDGGRVVDPGRLITAQKNSAPPPVWQLLCGPLALPNFDDPATLGCLVALVREAWGKPGIHARRMGENIWGVYADPWSKRRPLAVNNSEAAALVAALEAAP